MIITESPVTLTVNSVNCSKVVFSFPYLEVLSAADTSSLISWAKPTRPCHYIYHIVLSSIPKTPCTCKVKFSRKDELHQPLHKVDRNFNGRRGFRDNRFAECH